MGYFYTFVYSESKRQAEIISVDCYHAQYSSCVAYQRTTMRPFSRLYNVAATDGAVLYPNIAHDGYRSYLETPFPIDLAGRR